MREYCRSSIAWALLFSVRVIVLRDQAWRLFSNIAYQRPTRSRAIPCQVRSRGRLDPDPAADCALPRDDRMAPERRAALTSAFTRGQRHAQRVAGAWASSPRHRCLVNIMRRRPPKAGPPGLGAGPAFIGLSFASRIVALRLQCCSRRSGVKAPIDGDQTTQAAAKGDGRQPGRPAKAQAQAGEAEGWHACFRACASCHGPGQ